VTPQLSCVTPQLCSDTCLSVEAGSFVAERIRCGAAGVWIPMLRKGQTGSLHASAQIMLALRAAEPIPRASQKLCRRFRQLGYSVLGTAGRWVGVVFGHCDIAAIRVPDCEALRKMMPERWQRVRIEFEFECRNFLTHGHAIGFPLLRKLRGRD
jgi:hypothetical protein